VRNIKAKTKISVVVSIALLISFLFIFLSPKLVKSQEGYCGDGICDPAIGEDPYTCPQDCSSPPTTPSQEISYCTSITSSGEYYLTQDISSSELKCIDIQAYNVTLDCRGHIIKGVSASGSAGIYVYGFSSIKIINCIISDWDVGIYLERSSYIILSNITVTSNYNGIHLFQSDSSILSNITAISNSHSGIFLYYASYNIINGSVIQSNGASGVGLVESYTNMFYNNLFNNTNNFYFEGTIYTNYWNTTLQPGTNIWNSSLGYIGGNLWTNPSNTGYSDNCTDANFDGFCDQPYDLLGNGTNIDYLPLAKYVGQVYIPPSFSVVFNYNSVDFGIVTPNTIAEAKSINYNVSITTNTNYKVSVNATDWSGAKTIPANTIYFAVNDTLDKLSFVTAKQLSNAVQQVAIFPSAVTTNYHAFYFVVPVVPIGTYTATITITYEVA